jgi:hypothetical protein
VLAHARTPLMSIHRLYVGSLHFNLTESDIKQVFEPFGELEFVDLHRDPGTGRSKGYCFIQCVVTVVAMAGGSLMTGPRAGTRSRRTLRWHSSRWRASSSRADSSA